MKEKTTGELCAELGSTSSIASFLQRNQEYFCPQNSAEILKELILRKKIRKALLAERAGISGVYLYQILAGQRTPSRSRLICLCIGLALSLEETQEVLKQSGQAVLYARSKRDAVIIYGIINHLKLAEINDLLFDAGAESLN